MTRDRQCSRCGTVPPPAARFCCACGLPLGSPGTDESTEIFLPGPRDRFGDRRPLAPRELDAIASLPPGSAFLMMPRSSSADGARYLLDAERISMGRSPDNDICLDDVTVSRHHLELRREGHHYFVHDLASLNGTYLNRDRVELAALHDGDEVRVGKFRLHYYRSQP